MFETAELGRKVSKKEFDELEPELHTRLLAAQLAIRAANTPVIVLISGVEGASRGEVVNVLNKWLDARGVQTCAFWESSEEERDRPRFWRFWRVLPPRGTFAILFGSWYIDPIVEHAFRRIDRNAFEHELHRIAEFEQLLVDDGALIIKFWFHLSKEKQLERLNKDLAANIASPQIKLHSKHYDRFVEVSELAIRNTDVGHAPWHIIEATDKHYQQLTAGRILLDTLERHCSKTLAALPQSSPDVSEPDTDSTILDTVDLHLTMSDEDYEHSLSLYQEKLRRLTWQAKEQKRSTVLVFEGWDAAGKGGAIRRLIAGIDARLFRVISTSAPTDEEKAHHYLWRFWRHVPRAGHVTLYDRSWYGRVLVERVEGFAQRHEWQRAYQEINDFEEQLREHGVILCKFWLHISPEQQLQRFMARQEEEWKQYKLTEDDWRNRSHRKEYEVAVHDMVARTSTRTAPWTLVSANDKRVARISVLKTVCEELERELKSSSHQPGSPLESE
ncbi:MAG: polyphosphate:AMP phosphotransferase [Gammaproteobacteria bacterium]|nr:polyphosphate:AMP phosphotransferase [Gammaproteobacteria bacterium]